MGMGVCTCMCAPVCTCVVWVWVWVWVDKYKWTHVCYWPEALSLLILGGRQVRGLIAALQGSHEDRPVLA